MRNVISKVCAVAIQVAVRGPGGPCRGFEDLSIDIDRYTNRLRT